MSLKRSLRVLLTFVLFFSIAISVSNAADQGTLNPKNEKVEPDPKIVSLMEEYKVHRVKTQRIMESFREIHQLQDTRDAAVAGSQADRSLVIIRAKLEVIKDFLDAQSTYSPDKVNTYLIISYILSTNAEIVFKQFEAIFKESGNNINPLLKVALVNVQKALEKCRTTREGFPGDYCKKLVAAMKQALTDLTMILATLPVFTNADPVTFIKAHCETLIDILASQQTQGSEFDEHRTCCALMLQQCEFGSESIEKCLKFVGNKVNPLLLTSVGNVLKGLQAVCDKYHSSNTEYSVKYFKDFSAYIVAGMHDAATSLKEILKVI